MASKKDSPPGISRRVFLGAGARLSLLAAYCATVGTTIVTACMDPDDGGVGQGTGPNGKGDGYGYGYGYGCGYGGGYGYGYGYGCGY